ncbi:CesT family type III secretion system chaperone [Alcaligenes endophyticus]|uniref:CesT family type III secretion system chaperone n=1 Tax=Alcaligenes endophyticus TaxID=1929088 RepID=A0ABT8EFV6_9BURK|nr:CesT family type III secretion system chaperone [Alcaligenes endophyticus]MCX5590259.1 CesT family type III secretion system chaperone [Alcaligenes endophyticus]MDN4120077.1 CesT family type III secretion system chaperone [Alcaligenes endophyticus]
MQHSAASRLVSQLGLNLGIQGLQLDQNGLCTLLVDQRHLVHIALYKQHYLMLSCGLKPSPEHDHFLFPALLRANQHQGAEGVVFCLDEQQQIQAQLNLALSLCDADKLMQALETLLAELERWETWSSPAQVSTSQHDAWRYQNV